MRTTLCASILLTVLVTVPSWASNLLLNPDFDSDLAGWDTFASWSTEDWQASLDSGSATRTNDIPSASTISIVEQCVELPNPEEAYTLSGWMLNPAGQSGAGNGNLGVVFFSAAGCDDDFFIIGFDTPTVQQTGVWEQVSVETTTPGGTLSARVSTYIWKIGADGVLQIYVDHIGLKPPPIIFGDDFESGNVSGWSAISCNNDPAPPGGSCPPQCTGGCPGNVCIIDCSIPSSCEQMTIDCPPGFACDVQCAGDSSCAEAAINCPGNFSCNVSCDSVDSCSQATITCPVSAPCDVLCSGPPSSCSATLQVCGLGNCQATCTGGQSITTDCGAACSCLGCP